MISILIALVMGTGWAEEKTCTVKGMHCEACVDMIKDRLCTDQFDKCDVSVGKIHLKTKVSAEKIDEAKLNKEIADTTYSLGKCSAEKVKTKKL